MNQQVIEAGYEVIQERGLAKEWRKYQLGEITEIIGGGTPKTTVPEYWNGDIPWLSVVDFTGDKKYVYETEKSITDLGLTNSSTKILRAGQLIISARGTVGEIAVLKKDMAFNQSCYGLDAKDVTFNEFLYYLIKYNVNNVKRKTHGAVFDTITRTTFDHIEITLPPLSTQRRIAGILSALDDKIELNRQTNATLEAIAQAIFKEWFVNFNFPVLNYDLNDSMNTMIEGGKNHSTDMVESELGPIPLGWRVGKLGEIYQTTSGGTPSRNNPEFYENGTINWIKSKEINGSFIIDTEEKITQDALQRSSAKLLPVHSVLIAMYGATVGEFGIISMETACNQAICAFLPNNEFPFTFIYHILKFNKGEIISRAVGSAQQNISQDVLKRFEIILPPIKLLKEFHRIINPLFEVIENNIKQSMGLSQARDILLPKLMSGEVNV